MPDNQDLHIHTVYSTHDGAVAKEQTIELIANVKHAKLVGISDHFEDFTPTIFEDYRAVLQANNFHVGTEVNGADYVDDALTYDFEYYVYHCFDKDDCYAGAEKLVASGKPVIIAHPNFFDTKLERLPHECIIEINNRYVWRTDWRTYYIPSRLNNFRIIFSSDAHQPNWLNQNIAKWVGQELGVKETILF